jgi:hypothetical protein
MLGQQGRRPISSVWQGPYHAVPRRVPPAHAIVSVVHFCHVSDQNVRSCPRMQSVCSNLGQWVLAHKLCVCTTRDRSGWTRSGCIPGGSRGAATARSTGSLSSSYALAGAGAEAPEPGGRVVEGGAREVRGAGRPDGVGAALGCTSTRRGRGGVSLPEFLTSGTLRPACAPRAGWGRGTVCRARNRTNPNRRPGSTLSDPMMVSFPPGCALTSPRRLTPPLPATVRLARGRIPTIAWTSQSIG